MSQENVEIVRRAFETYNRGALDEFLSELSDDCEWRPPSYAVDGVAYLGHEGYREWYAGLNESWSSVRLTPRSFSEVGPGQVLAEIAAEFVGRASSTPVSQRFWNVYSLGEGKIVRMEAFPSEEAALEAVSQSGLSE